MAGLAISQRDRLKRIALERRKIVKDAMGSLALLIESNLSFALLPNELSKGFDSLVCTQTAVTVRGQLYKKPPGTKSTKSIQRFR